MNAEEWAKQKGEGFTQEEINLMRLTDVKEPPEGFKEKDDLDTPASQTH